MTSTGRVRDPKTRNHKTNNKNCKMHANLKTLGIVHPYCCLSKKTHTKRSNIFKNNKRNCWTIKHMVESLCHIERKPWWSDILMILNGLSIRKKDHKILT